MLKESVRVQDGDTKRKLQTTVNKRVRVGECESKRAREKVRGDPRNHPPGSPSKIQIKLFNPSNCRSFTAEDFDHKLYFLAFPLSLFRTHFVLTFA